MLSGATLSLWARVENITMEDVEEALWKHWTLVKTWAMRGTLHLLSSNSLSTYIAALRTRYNLHGEKISYRIGRDLKTRDTRSSVPAHSVRLVPSWDTYVMFYHPRESFVPQEYRTRIFRQIQGNAAVLLIDGVAAGTWEKTKKKAGIEITVSSSRP